MRVANINTNLRKFFHHWITVTRPMHNLGKTERGVLAELLYFRHLLSVDIPSEELIDKLLFDYDVKLKICNALGIPKSRIALVLTKLRKEGIVIGRTLNKSYIPEIKEGDTQFIIAYKFKFNNDSEGTSKEKSSKKIQKNSKSA